MNNLPNSLVKKAAKWVDLDEETQLEVVEQLYEDYKLSWHNVGKLCGTNHNRVRRFAKKHGKKSRDKSEAQSIALEEGRSSIPTEGGHTEKTKVKISEGVADNWEAMTEEEREERRKGAKERWESMTPEEIKRFREAAGEGVRTAAKEGSALERFLLEECIKAGYKVQFHKEHWVIRESLQIDLYFPEINTALEVDGPSHFKNIWGEDQLRRLQYRDSQKNGLLLQRGCCIIRVRQTQALSEKYKREILASVLETLEKIKNRRPSGGNRLIILGEENA